MTALFVIGSSGWFAHSILFIWAQSADNSFRQDLVISQCRGTGSDRPVLGL
jgi:hypothetical protein